MIEACQQEKDPKQVKKNLFALMLDVISYWVGAAFTDPMTVLLLLMQRLGAGATLIGLCIALRFAAQYGVQVFVAYIMHGKPHQKPFLVWAVGVSRLPLVALPFFIWHSADSVDSRNVALWATIIILALVGLGEGLGGIPWTEIVARTFDEKTRGRFFSGSQIAAGVLNIFIALALVTHILKLPYPINYTILVGMSALMFQFSTLGLMLIDEPRVPDSAQPRKIKGSLREYLLQLPRRIKEDKTFARLVTIQFFINAGWAALPFYITFAKQRFHPFPDSWGGTYQLLQAVSVALLMPVWTLLSEKMSPAAAVRGVAFVCMITPMVALITGFISPWHFGLVFLLTGGSLTAGGIWVVINHFLLAHTEEEDRPQAVALLNLLNLPCALFPLLGSALVRNDQFIMIGKVPVLLVLTAITVSIGFFLSLSLTTADDEELTPAPETLKEHNVMPFGESALHQFNALGSVKDLKKPSDKAGAAPEGNGASAEPGDKKSGSAESADVKEPTSLE